MDKEQLVIQLEEALHVINEDIELVRRQAQRRGLAPADLVDQMGRPKLRPLMESRVQAILALVMLNAAERSEEIYEKQDNIVEPPTYDPTAPYFR